MGSFKYFKIKRYRGKVDTLLNNSLKSVEWGEEVYLTELFTIKRGKRLTVENRVRGNRPLVTAGYENTGVAEFIGNDKQEIFSKDTITIDMFGNTFYRNYCYSADDNILILFDKKSIQPKAKLFIVNLINRIISCKFSYGKQYRMGSFNQTKIQLPIKNQNIDFKFMESFITELEKEQITKLETYLLASDLKDYTLTDEEQQILDDYKNNKFKWKEFNLKELFGKSTRGKRLKSSDRISGTLPFVTAGETDAGISAFIGNDVTIFSDNTITIDMFGSAKYRNYKYGGDDHIAVVNTQDLHQLASIFVTSAIHKSSYTGEFHYGRNFYAKNADELNISLPIKNKEPDYKLMETLISAIQKQVIKDVVLYTDKKLGKS